MSESAPTPLLLIPGFAQRAATFEELCACLRDAREVEVLDLYSELPCSFDQAAGLIQEALGRLQTQTGQKPAVLGYSQGGRLLSEALGRGIVSPSMVSLVLFESAGLGPQDENERGSFVTRSRDWQQRVATDGVEAFMAWWATLPLFASQRSLPRELQQQLMEERTSWDGVVLTQSLEAWGQQYQAFASQTLDTLAQVAASGVTVGYLAGVLDTKYMAVAQRVKEAVPESVVAAVEGVGHNVHLEAPSAVAAYVEALLKIPSEKALPDCLKFF